MTSPVATPQRDTRFAAEWARHPGILWVAFLAVHAWLFGLNLYGYGLPLGDVTIVYTFWVDRFVSDGYLVGIDSAWVYPILAILPMFAALVAGPENYAAAWLVLMALLNAAAFGTLLAWRARASAWWWLAFLAVLGPIALGRIDAVTVPLAIIGSLLAARQPRVATTVLTIAAWVKVWPAALIGALIIVAKDRWRIVSTALIVSAAIVATALLMGSGGNVLSFITQQTGRGLQVEAPVTTIWLWRVLAGDPATRVYYDDHILTWQVEGPGVAETAALMTVVQALAVAALIALAIYAVRGGATATELLAPLSLAFVAALIAFNKVGSPQFVSWLAVPVIVGLTQHWRGRGWSFTWPAVVTVVIAALTHVMYPYLYGYVLTVHPLMLMVITVRNGLYFVLIVWAVVRLWRLAHDEPG
ncbi:MAG TPA: glycosyltransferase 87 family protein [Terrimesophilobacter sp.]|nr:glycosyltransferase 87 family protein [Terrimesophilobacter sp.]